MLAGLAAILATSCHGGHATQERPPAEPASASGAAHAAASGGEDELDGSMYQGAPKISVVLADPRLATAREREQSHDWSGAAQAMEAARVAANLDGPHACAWQYLAGRLHLAAGDSSEAAAAFARVVSPGDGVCPLAAYAALQLRQIVLST